MDEEFQGANKAYVKAGKGAREKHRSKKELKKSRKEGLELDASAKAAKARNPRVRHALF